MRNSTKAAARTAAVMQGLDMVDGTQAPMASQQPTDLPEYVELTPRPEGPSLLELAAAVHGVRFLQKELEAELGRVRDTYPTVDVLKAEARACLAEGRQDLERQDKRIDELVTVAEVQGQRIDGLFQAMESLGERLKRLEANQAPPAAATRKAPKSRK